MSEPRARQHDPTADVFLGLVVGVVVSLFCQAVAFFAVMAIWPGYAALWVPALVGITQLVYMVPAILIAQNRGRPGLVKGLIIVAAVVFILNGACWGVSLISSL